MVVASVGMNFIETLANWSAMPARTLATPVQKTNLLIPYPCSCERRPPQLLAARNLQWPSSGSLLTAFTVPISTSKLIPFTRLLLPSVVFVGMSVCLRLFGCERSRSYLRIRCYGIRPNETEVSYHRERALLPDYFFERNTDPEHWVWVMREQYVENAVKYAMLVHQVVVSGRPSDQ